MKNKFVRHRVVRVVTKSQEEESRVLCLYLSIYLSLCVCMAKATATTTTFFLQTGSRFLQNYMEMCYLTSSRFVRNAFHTKTSSSCSCHCGANAQEQKHTANRCTTKHHGTFHNIEKEQYDQNHALQ
mmetsp:Transcript_13293/g.19554  ORF Transcript_13293/g.19554 Transcript_13293/m.19554 type:complete len:127 (-) Transcript_13293:1946-2326(-)